MAERKPTTVLRAQYQGEPVSRAVPSALPQQAAARQHSQWARCAEYYQHVWRFSLDGEPPDDDEVQSYIDACDGMPESYEAMKVYIRDGELTVMVRTGKGPVDGGGPGQDSISPNSKGNQ